MKQTRLCWLDAFRFLSALAVLLTHARASTFVEFGALPQHQKSVLVAAAFALTRLGYEAVAVFFVLSGFLVGGSAIEQMARGSFRALDYAIDRATRILLPFVPALILTACVAWVTGSGTSAWLFAGNLLALQDVLVLVPDDNRPLWSLSYEIWFYLLLLAVGLGVSARRFRLGSALLIVVCFAVFTRLSWSYLACMFLGAFARLRQPEKPSATLWAVSSGLCAAAVAALQLGSDTTSVRVDAVLRWLPPAEVSRIVLGVGTALLIQQLVLAKPRHALTRNLDSAGSVLAAFSYTLYLTHYPLLRAMRYLGLERAMTVDVGSTSRFALVVFACLAAAWVLYVLFEKQTQRVRSWVRSRIDAPGGRHSAKGES